MLTTIWMCTQEWSLIFIRTTALTFATCHHAFSCASLLTRSRTRRSLRLPRSGRRMRMPVTASAGLSRVSRTASAETGPSMRCSISGSSGVSVLRRARGRSSWQASSHTASPGAAAGIRSSSRRAISRRACVRALPSRSRLTGSLSHPLAPEGCGSGIDDRAVDQVALADALGQRSCADERLRGEAADGEHEAGAEQAELLARASGRRAAARPASACGRRGLLPVRDSSA